MSSLWIPGRLPGLNEIIEACKGHWSKYREMKSKWGHVVVLAARVQGFGRITVPSHFRYEFHEPNRRRDPSNIAAGGIKIVEDALQEARLLEDDSQKWVKSITSTVTTEGEVGVMLTVEENGTEEGTTR